MKRLALYVFAVIVCVCAVAQQGEYSITGKDYHGTSRVYLQEVGFGAKLDSAEVKDGTFTFKGQTNQTRYVEIITKEGELMGQFILEPGKVSLSGNNYYGKGAPLNDAFTNLVNEIAPFEKLYYDGKLSEDELSKMISNKVVAQVDAHMGDALSARSLYYFNSYIEKFTFKDLYDRGSEGLKAVPGLKQLRANYELTAQTEEGMMYKDFAVEYEGKIQRLSDYVGKGKYVLIDFWASWCGPCKKEIPNIIEVWNKYKDKNFVAVGIATSDKPEDTKVAMKQLGIEYPQIMNNQGEASEPYGVTYIPQIILFGPDGTILRRGLRGPDIKAAVEKYLGN